MKNLPKYFLVGLRPVKVIRNEEGRLGSLAYNWETSEFDLAIRYLDEIFSGKGDDVETITELEFEEKVKELRIKLKEKQDSSK